MESKTLTCKPRIKNHQDSSRTSVIVTWVSHVYCCLQRFGPNNTEPCRGTSVHDLVRHIHHLTSLRTSAAVNLSMTSTISNATMSVSGLICLAWKSAGKAKPSSWATSSTNFSTPSPRL